MFAYVVESVVIGSYVKCYVGVKNLIKLIAIACSNSIQSCMKTNAETGTFPPLYSNVMHWQLAMLTILL